MSVLEYAYDFGDGTAVVRHLVTDPNVAGATDSIQHHYAAAGTYTVTLTLRERKGNQLGRVLGTATTQVTVGPTRGQPAPSTYGGYRSSYSFPNYAKSG